MKIKVYTGDYEHLFAFEGDRSSRDEVIGATCSLPSTVMQFGCV